LEFCWVGDDGVDPLEQAQTIAILVNAGVKTVAEARAELGLGPENGVAKFSVQSIGQKLSFRAQQNAAGDFVDAQSNIVATVDIGPDGQRTLAVGSASVDTAISASAGSTSGSS
jgi:hypothetical protein